jgi:hypothetical protein
MPQQEKVSYIRDACNDTQARGSRRAEIDRSEILYDKFLFGGSIELSHVSWRGLKGSRP